MRTFKGKVEFIGAAAGTVAKARVVVRDAQDRSAAATIPSDHELRFGDEVEITDDGKVRATVMRPQTIKPGEEGNEGGSEAIEVSRARDVEYEGLDVSADAWTEAPSEPTPPTP